MKSILNVDVSLFTNYTDANSIGEVSLFEWLTSDGYYEEIVKLRKAVDENKKQRIKKSLPAITPSALIKGKRNKENVVKHSGFICIDIDGKDNPHITDWDVIKNSLRNNVNIAYAGLSASGNGLFVIIPVAYPEKHDQHFYALEHYFSAIHNINIDVGCKDITRLRGISYDENPVINHNAQPFFTCIDKEDYKPVKHTNSAADELACKNIIDEILSLKTDITGCYQDWFGLGCVIANVYGEKGRSIYHELSSLSNKYNHKECDKQFDACLKKEYNYSLGTVIHLYNKYK